MHRRVRGTSSLRMASCLTPGNLMRGESGSLLSQRIFAGCLIPTPENLISAAIGALRQHSDDLQPAFLISANRSVQLSARRANAVPESLVVDGITGDPQYAYFKHYAAAAMRSLEEAELPSAELCRSILSQYWKYLQTVVTSGVEIPDGHAGDFDPSLHILLRPTLATKLLARTPFKHSSQASKYATTVATLRDALHRLQQYFFFMRPDNPSAPSADTALRLNELLAYVSVLYGWASWMMWTTDKYVCHRLAPSKRKFVNLSKTFETPMEMFTRHIERGPGGTTGSLQCMALRAAISDVFSNLKRLSHLWEHGKRSSGSCGTTEAVVSTIEVVSLVHHHAQYLIHGVLTGYVIWASGGLENDYLRAAVESQERFCHNTAPLFATMTTPSWARMEMSMKAWFGASLAADLFQTGTPSPHYEAILRLLATHGPTAHPPLAPAPVAPGRGPLTRSWGPRSRKPCKRADFPLSSTKSLLARPLSTPATMGLPSGRPRERGGAPREVAESLVSVPLTLGGECVEPLSTLQRLVGVATAAASNATSTYYTHMDAPPQLPPRNRTRRVAQPPGDTGEYDRPRDWVAPVTPAGGADNPYLAPEDSDSPREAPLTEPETVYQRQQPIRLFEGEEDPYLAPKDDDEDVYEEISDGSQDAPVYEEIPEGRAEARVYEEIPEERAEACVYEEIQDGQAEACVYEEIPETTPRGRRAPQRRRLYQNMPMFPPQEEPESPVLESPPSILAMVDNDLYDWGSEALFSPPTEAASARPALPPRHRPRANAINGNGPTNMAALSALLTKMKHDRRQSH
ncbi:tegument protein VP11/12 [Pteropodid alphaherpesvirus 1]|uniref:Tegument protein VP11/12 n=1 Tax=Pteropodid alphaherpesvirus 1 TaxID=1343901 RepID=A0A060Q4Z8_9ALPH|nr:tegument protein VP11/12 [Pteropodid alphaherpesvirus 1]BAP00725.1 tegument protein VP11/12 [Pteropodid alphaherpesvirus 1]